MFEFVLWIRGNNCFIDKQLTNGVCVLPIELEDWSEITRLKWTSRESRHGEIICYSLFTSSHSEVRMALYVTLCFLSNSAGTGLM